MWTREVQETAVPFPTDSKLCHTAREAVVAAAKTHDVALLQRYVRKSRQPLYMANRYMSPGRDKKEAPFLSLTLHH
jgi:hypothetical protein